MLSFPHLIRSLRISLTALVISPLAVLAQDAGSVDARPASLKPEVQSGDWWMPRHEAKLAEKEAMESVDLLWVGDSITHGWESTGKSVWDEYYANRNALNLGFSGDRTEQVLWRIEHGEVDGISPKLIVMMIGTNNTGHRQDPAGETAAGVSAIIDQLKSKMPEAKILLLGIFPRDATVDGPMRKLNADINNKLVSMADSDSVTYMNIGDEFLDENGGLPKSIMPDLLHPNAAGYKIWAEAIEPFVAKNLGPLK